MLPLNFFVFLSKIGTNHDPSLALKVGYFAISSLPKSYFSIPNLASIASSYESKSSSLLLLLLSCES